MSLEVPSSLTRSSQVDRASGHPQSQPLVFSVGQDSQTSHGGDVGDDTGVGHSNVGHGVIGSLGTGVGHEVTVGRDSVGQVIAGGHGKAVGHSRHPSTIGSSQSGQSSQHESQSSHLTGGSGIQVVTGQTGQGMTVDVVVAVREVVVDINDST